MSSDLPRVSVITVVFNDAGSIEQTLKSVLDQSYPNLEYVVIDGGSTDGTLEIIKRYLSRITYFSTEPDKGIYFAMNKGTEAAKGDWINFMNSGDWFYRPTTIETIFNGRDLGSVDLIYGNTERRDQGVTFISVPGHSPIFYHNMMVHQSIFSRRELNLKYPFNTRYRVAADFDFIFRVFFFKHRALYLDLPISSYSILGYSNHNRYMGYKEKRHSALSHRGNFKLSLAVYLYFWYDALRGRSIDLLKRLVPGLYSRLKAYANRKISYY